MKTARSIICLALAAVMLLGAPATAFAEEAEAQEAPVILLEETAEELPAEEPEETEEPSGDPGEQQEEQEPDGFPASDGEMTGNTTDSSRLWTRAELSDIYGITENANADVVSSLISDEARTEFSEAIDRIAAFEPVSDGDVAGVLGKVESFVASGGVGTYLQSGNTAAGREIGLSENRLDKVKILGTDANASGWVFVVDKDATSWFIQGPDGVGIPYALVTISYVDDSGERVTTSKVASAGHTPGIAVFDELPDSFFGIVDIQAEGYRAVTILDRAMGLGDHETMVLEESQPDEIYIRGVDLAGKDMVNEETKLCLVSMDTADLALKVLVTKTGNAAFPETIDIRSDTRDSTVLTLSRASGYAYDSNTVIYAASKRWAEKDAGLLQEGDKVSIGLGSGSFSLEHLTVENAVVNPGSGETEVPVTTKSLNGNVSDRLSGGGFLNQTMQMLNVPVQFGMFPDGTMMLMASYDITRLNPDIQSKFSSLFQKSWNPKDTENLQDPLEIFEESFWENAEKVKKGDQILESDSKIKHVSNWSYDFSISFSLYLKSCYNKETDDNFGSGGILFSGSFTGGLTEYFLLPVGPVVIPAYIGFEGHFAINTQLCVNFGMDRPPTGHDKDKEWSYSTDDGTDVNGRIEVIAGFSIFGGIGVKGVLGVSAVGYCDFDLATVIGKGRAEFGQPHSFIDVLYGLKFDYYLLFYSGTIKLDALNGAIRLADSNGEHDLAAAAAESMEFTDIPLAECAEDFVLQAPPGDGEPHDEKYTLRDAGGSLEGQPDVITVDSSTYPDTQLQFAATADYTALFRLGSNGERTDIYYQIQNPETGNFWAGLCKVRLPEGETRSVSDFVVVPNKTGLDDPDHRNKVYIGAVLVDNTLTDENERMRSSDVAAIVVDLDREYTTSSVIASDPAAKGAYLYSAPMPAGREGICSVAYAATRLTDDNGAAVDGLRGLLGSVSSTTNYYISWGADGDPGRRSIQNLGRNRVYSTGAIAPNEPSFWTVDAMKSSDKYLYVKGYGANGYYEDTLRCNFRIDIEGLVDKQEIIDGTVDFDRIITDWQYLNGCSYFIAGGSVYWMNKAAKGGDPADYEWVVEKVVNGSGVVSADNRYAMITNNEQSAVYLIGVVGDYDVDVEAGTSEKGYNIAKIHTITTDRSASGELTCTLHGPLDIRFSKGDIINCFAAAYNPAECASSGLTIAYSSPSKNQKTACIIKMWKQNADRGMLVTGVRIPDYLVLTGQPAVEVFVTVRNYGYGLENHVQYDVYDGEGHTLMLTNGTHEYVPSTYFFSGDDLYTGDSRVDRLLVRPDPDWKINEEHEIVVEVTGGCEYNGNMDDVVNATKMEADNITLTAKNALVGGKHTIRTSIVNNTLTGLDSPTVKIVLDYGRSDGETSELNFPLPMRERILPYGEDDDAYVGQSYFFDIDMDSVWEDGLDKGLRGAWVSLVDEDGVQRSNETIYLINPAEAKDEQEEAVPEFKVQNLVLSGQLGVNFFLDLPEIDGVDYADSYVEFTVSGKGGSTSRDAFDPDFTNATGEYYGFTCCVKSIQMAETITAVFHYGDGKTVSREYSVAEYVEAFEEHKDQFDEKTITLVHAIADYGHYIQIYLASVNGFAIGEDYAKMSRHFTETYDYADVLSKVEAYAIAKARGGSKVERANYRLQLGSETTVDVFLKTTDGSAPTNVTVTIREEVSGKTTETAVTPVKQADGRYLVRIPNVSAHRLGDRITIEGEAGGNFRVEVSALSYVRDVLTYNKDTESRDGLSSLYAYCAAAVACR